jgi:hypothetical protein
MGEVMNAPPNTQQHLLPFKSSMTFQVEGNDLYLTFLDSDQVGARGYLFVMNGWGNSKSRLESIYLIENYNYRIQKDYGFVDAPPINGWTDVWVRITLDNKFQVGHGNNFTPVFEQLLEEFIEPKFVGVSKYPHAGTVNVRQLRIN